jgi:hypothetical protein
MRQTRDELQATADRLTAENTLLIQYVSDVENGIGPTASESEGKGADRVQGKLFRPLAGHGGIAVIKYRAGDKWDTHVLSLEQFESYISKDYSEHTVNVRTVVSRLVSARNRAYAERQAA